MHTSQEQFMNYIVASIENENRESAIALLEESFTRQAQGTLTQVYLNEVISKMLGFVKQEKYNEVKANMEAFKNSLF